MTKWIVLLAGILAAAPAAAEDLPVVGGIAISPTLENDLRVYVTRERAPRFEAPVQVGSKIPTRVALHLLPPAVTTDIPVTRTYRYLETPSGIAIVNPDDRTVVRIFAAR